MKGRNGGSIMEKILNSKYFVKILKIRELYHKIEDYLIATGILALIVVLLTMKK